MQNRWQACLERLAKQISDKQFQTWIRPLTPVSFEGGVLTVAAASPQARDWVASKYAGDIGKAASEAFDGFTGLTVALAQKRPAQPPKKKTAKAATATGAPAETDSPAVKDAAFYRFSHLNPLNTFDTYVSGKANELAIAAAENISGKPGQTYNPFFLYGGVGLGKTHLAHAIGNAIHGKFPEKRIRYVRSSDYIRDVVTATQSNQSAEFRRSYQSLDVLIIDDVQFFAGKQRTQEEFFLVFESFIADKKQLIVTSDRLPQDTDLERRLVSRFDSALKVIVEPPELEMRVAILMKKASLAGITLPDDVAFYIARPLASNVRELEGALNRLIAYTEFMKVPVSIESSREALKDIFAASNRTVSVDTIQKAVADFYRIKVADMFSKKRPAAIARPRQIAMYLAKEMTQKSLPEIGELFGGRDHTTVLHAVRKIREQRSVDVKLASDLSLLEQTIKG